MCGIFAVFSKNEKLLPSNTESRLNRVIDIMNHRGPDAKGAFVAPQRDFALGHVRLSIIDIHEASNQPFWSECGQYVVVFNGEIYNYKELRNDLKNEGVVFKGESDTEVLMQSIIRWGIDACRRFNGMWAFVYGDLKSRQFIISRDRFGVKPLFVYQDGNYSIFSSESKGIISFLNSTPAPNRHSIGLYLKYGISGEHHSSWFDGIYRVNPAEVITIKLGSKGVISNNKQTYWKYPTERTIIDLPEAIEQLGNVLKDAVRLRLRSDVPLGLSLSGGIDSGLLAGIIQEDFGLNINVFTAYFEPLEESELPKAKRLAEKLGHNLTPILTTSESNVLGDLKTSVYHLEAGHSSPAIVPYMRLCREARKKVKVLIEGQGADELLAGYDIFKLFAGIDSLFNYKPQNAYSNWKWYINLNGWFNFIANLARFSFRPFYLHQDKRWGAWHILSDSVLMACPENIQHISLSRSNLADAVRFSHVHGLTNLLAYGDALSMAAGLETRCPFMDYRVVELCFRLSSELLVKKGWGKLPLRVLASNKLPDDISWYRKKDGFTNPIAKIVHESCSRSGLPALGMEYGLDIGIFKPRVRDKLFISHLPNHILFRIYCLSLWFECYYTN